ISIISFFALWAILSVISIAPVWSRSSGQTLIASAAGDASISTLTSVANFSNSTFITRNAFQPAWCFKSIDKVASFTVKSNWTPIFSNFSNATSDASTSSRAHPTTNSSFSDVSTFQTKFSSLHTFSAIAAVSNISSTPNASSYAYITILSLKTRLFHLFVHFLKLRLDPDGQLFLFPPDAQLGLYFLLLQDFQLEVGNSSRALRPSFSVYTNSSHISNTPT
ncbi:hypothetical protein TYRP_004627, partial [Tyrophagus putrescentiae]